MSNRRRDLLHKNKLQDFREWALAQGLDAESTKGEFEVLRLRDRGDNLSLFYVRFTGDHITSFGEGTKLVHRYLREKKSK